MAKKTRWGVYDYKDGAMCDCSEHGIDPAPFELAHGTPAPGELACENCGGFI